MFIKDFNSPFCLDSHNNWIDQCYFCLRFTGEETVNQKDKVTCLR